MALEASIAKSKEWMEKSVNFIDGMKFDTTERLRVSLSLLHLSMEHQKGIHVLVDMGVIGSAFALVRPQLEAYVRGIWFHRCATDNEIKSFLTGNQPPKINVLIEAIEKLDGFNDGTLSRFKKEIWRNLNDFTHGGAIQVKSRNTLDEITINYKVEHIAGLLQSSVTLAWLAGNSMAYATENTELAKNLQSLYKDLYESEP